MSMGKGTIARGAASFSIIGGRGMQQHYCCLDSTASQVLIFCCVTARISPPPVPSVTRTEPAGKQGRDVDLATRYYPANFPPSMTREQPPLSAELQLRRPPTAGRRSACLSSARVPPAPAATWRRLARCGSDSGGRATHRARALVCVVSSGVLSDRWGPPRAALWAG